MNTSLADANKEAMVISQFTLFGNLRKGTRPSFNEAALPKQAIPLYETFIEELGKRLEKPVASGSFGAHMDIDMRQDGPVTLLIDTKRRDF
jgi:D-tyrosyl-tRNA(Tyr) deacylase